MTRICVSCLLALSLAAPAETPVQMPAHWGVNNSDGYTATIDHSVARSGAASALITSKSPSASGFGGLIQATEAANYRGKRIRFSGDLKTQGAQDWAGLWFRADDRSGKVLAFDNMQLAERRVRNDTDWQRYSLVLDIPADASIVLYGVTLSGTGKVWADALEIETVDLSVPVTSAYLAQGTNLTPVIAPPSVPRNLDFEQSPGVTQ